MLWWQPHHQGFLCAECDDDYKAIDGECTLCDKVDYHWIFTEGVVAILIGLFLLTKTFKSVCKPADANAVFDIIDSSKNGYLTGEDVRSLLVRMGNPIAAASSFDETLADMKAKDVWEGATLGPLWGALPECLGGISKPDPEWVHRESVSKHEFLDWCTINQ